MTVNCDYCDSSLDPLTGKCPLCEDTVSDDPNLGGLLDEEYVDTETEPIYDVSDDLLE